MIWEHVGQHVPTSAHHYKYIPSNSQVVHNSEGARKNSLGARKNSLGSRWPHFGAWLGSIFTAGKINRCPRGPPPNRVSQTWCKKWLKSRTKKAPQTDQGHNSFVESKTPNTDLQLKMTPEHGSNMYDKCDFSLFSSCVDVSKAVQCLKFLHRFERFCFTFSSSNGWLISLSFRRDCF